jgi:ppGpp synthetase/RelA/SpoT-type nucleotidyltranferase
MPTAEVNRLGDRIRASAAVSDQDLNQLQELRREFDGALATAQSLVSNAIPGSHPTSRLKTVQTLVAKMKRLPTMNLSQVQDVAGMRIVQKVGLQEQDALAARIGALFGRAKLVDRRSAPSFGYRAVHVIVQVEGRNVEIQIRTFLQDRWAQILERLADYWGRQIRYGGEPDKPRHAVGQATRVFVVDLTRRISPLIASCEQTPAPGGPKAAQPAVGVRYCQAVETALAQLGALEVTNEGIDA